MSKLSLRRYPLFLTLCVFTLIFAPALQQLMAQEATATETPTEILTVVTETPTPIPSETPTDSPTETATPTETSTLSLPEATQTLETSPTTEANATSAASPTGQPLPPEPILAVQYSGDFDSGNLSAWTFGMGWALIPDPAGGQALQVFNSSEAAVFNQGSLFNAVAEARFQIQYGTAQLTVRQSASGNYAATLDASGQVSLYRSGSLIQSAAITPLAPDQWRTLRLSAMNDVVRVTVDSMEVIVFQDPAPLPAGGIALNGLFSTLPGDATPALPLNTVQVDNFVLLVPADELIGATATETATAAPTATDTPSAAPTDIAVPPEPPLTLLFNDTFDSSELLTWMLGAGWTLVPNEGGQALQVAASDEAVTFVYDNLNNVAAQARFLLSSGMARLSVQQSEAGSYTVLMDMNGQVGLYRGGQALGSAVVSPTTPGEWRVLRLSAIDNVIRVAVDGTEVIAVQDTDPLPQGTLSFAGVGIGDSALLVDDFYLWIPSAEMPATATPTPEALPAEPELELLFRDHFDSGNLSAWTLGNGWGLVASEDGQALQAANTAESALYNGDDLFNAAVQARFLLNVGSAHLSARQSVEGSYTASIDVNGQVALYRGEVLLGSATVDLVPVGQWRTVRLSAIEDVVRVSVDGVEVIALRDAQPLPAGVVSFAASDLGESVLLVDDAEIWVPLTDLPLPEEPELGLLFSDNFDNSDLSAWTLGANWALAPSEDGQALEITNSAEAAVLNLDSYFNVAAQAQFLFNTGSVRLTLRESEAGRYAAVLSIDGQVSLYRADELLVSAPVDSWLPDGWHTLRFSTMEDVLRVSVDGVEVIAVQNPEPLAAGSVSFVGSDLGESTLLVDNFELWVPLSELSVVPEPPLAVLFSDGFDTSSGREWMFGTGWTEGLSTSSRAIETRHNGEVLPMVGNNLENAVIETTVQINSGAVQLRIREGEGSSYSLVFDANGQLSLYRGETLLQSANVTPSGPWDWRLLRFSVIQNTLRAAVDGAEIMSVLDPQPLPAGQVSLVSVFPTAGAGVLRVDEVIVLVPQNETPNIGSLAAVDAAAFDVPQTLFEQQMSEQAVALQAEEDIDCIFDTSIPPLTDGRIIDLVTFSDWEGGGHRNEIRIKIPDATGAYVAPGYITDEIGQKLIGNYGTGETFPAISPDGTRVAFASNCISENDDGIYVFDLNSGDQPQPLTTISNGWADTQPVWSPDGTRIAFLSNRDGMGWKIWVMDAFDRDGNGEGDNLHRVTTNAAGVIENYPAWSPDGRLIAYAAGACPGRVTYDIYETNAYGQPTDCSSGQVLATGPRDDYHPAWSPDGQFIAFTSYPENENYARIYLTHINPDVNIILENPDPNGENWVDRAVNLTYSAESNFDNYSTQPAWSPDGTRIAFASNELNGGAITRMHILNLEIGEVQEDPVTHKKTLSVNAVNGTTWGNEPKSGHGFWIVFGGGPAWSQYVSCYPEGVDPYDGANYRRTGLRGDDGAVKRACLLEYRGAIFFAYYHEASNASFRSIPDLVVQYLDFPNITVVNHRYLYARTLTNKILGAANVPLIRTGDGYGMNAFNLGAIIDFESWSGLSLNSTSGDRRAPRFNDLIEAEFGTGSRYGETYAEFLPYLYMAVHDAGYNTTNIIEDPTVDDYLTRAQLLLAASICVNWDYDRNEETGVIKPSCHSNQEPDQIVPGWLVSGGDNPTSQQVRAAYACYLQDTSETSIRQYTPLGDTLIVRTLRTDFEFDANQKPIFTDIHSYTWLSLVFQLPDDNPDETGILVWAGVGPEPLTLGGESCDQ
jgi:Tol biopolymer transport system component